MRRYKIDWLSPYVSDVVAFALLGISLVVVVVGAMTHTRSEVQQARLYESGMARVTKL